MPCHLAHSGHVKWESIIPSDSTAFELVPERRITLISGFAAPAFSGFLINLGNNKTYWQVGLVTMIMAGGRRRVLGLPLPHGLSSGGTQC